MTNHNDGPQPKFLAQRLDIIDYLFELEFRRVYRPGDGANPRWSMNTNRRCLRRFCENAR